MSKYLAGLAGILFLLVIAVPGTAGAAQRNADGVRTAEIGQYEFSGHRRSYRHRHRHVRRYYRGPRYGYYHGGPYWRPRYSYYSPYYAAAPFPFFPFFPFGIGW